MSWPYREKSVKYIIRGKMAFFYHGLSLLGKRGEGQSLSMTGLAGESGKSGIW